MKTKLFTLALICVSTAAFAQGKITFINDISRLFAFGVGSTLPADAAYSGQPIPTSPLPSGKTLQALMYGGTSAGSLTLRQAIPLVAANMAAPGLMSPPTSHVFSDIPGGSPAWFKVIWADTDGVLPGVIDGNVPAANYFLGFTYFASSALFTAVPGSSISYPVLYQTTSPVNSTWPAAYIVNVIPEPSSLALLGVAAGMLFRFRRNQS